MDQRFHRLLHFRALWRRNLAVVAADRAFRHLLKTLLHNADGLTHFFNADHEPVIAITTRADRNVKIHFGIYVIWLALADIPWNARATDHWPRKAPFDRVFFRDNRDIHVTLFENTVVDHQ